MKILAVDDDSITLYALKCTLSKAGYEVISATNGFEALEKLRTDRFDLIITDLYMPNMDGDELLVEARELNPGIGVIIITAYGKIESYIETKNLGAFEYLNKPINSTELKRVIESYQQNSLS